MSSNIRVHRICQYCNAVFVAKTTVTKYCSDACAKKAYKQRKKEEKLEASNRETENIVQAPLRALKEKEYLNLDDVCELLNISRTTLFRIRKKGDLQFIKLGGRPVISKKNIENFFNY
ncbi:helix-turn-helix domain-containing protein [Echinicola soli]|uniref:Helix-turn-helix domain-containing protein n=1 Tax=Echinicola soli TaxID=2591634 RepID=A0A514CKU9_9BACT|nr:helix-turn-helix domain-containing protein [Echinicola soli]QDH80449.1 helix-turn-helix domain-containing protein [Echinicola soli]